jgi:SAM-dependent methyltransferase
MPFTSRLRASYSLKELNKQNSHLDIGCGDCLFLKLSPCERRVGLDVRFGDYVNDCLDFPDESFDNVTMLAFIEHIQEPEQLIKEIYRVLKPHGPWAFDYYNTQENC